MSSVSEILNELNKAKSNGGIWWRDLISVPLAILNSTKVSTGTRVPILYKGKQLSPMMKGERVLFSTRESEKFTYTPVLKIGEGDSYELIRLLQDEIVYPLIKAHIALGNGEKETELMKYILENPDIEVKYLVNDHDLLEEDTEYALIEADEFSNKTKVVGDSKFFDLKVYPNTVVSTLDKQHSQHVLSASDLKGSKVVNTVFPMGSLVYGNMTVSLYISDRYISLVPSLGKKVISDQRQVNVGFTLDEIADMTGFNCTEEDCEE